MEEQLDPDTLLEKVFETPGYQVGEEPCLHDS